MKAISERMQSKSIKCMNFYLLIPYINGKSTRIRINRRKGRRAKTGMSTRESTEGRHLKVKKRGKEKKRPTRNENKKLHFSNNNSFWMTINIWNFNFFALTPLPVSLILAFSLSLSISQHRLPLLYVPLNTSFIPSTLQFVDLSSVYVCYTSGSCVYQSLHALNSAKVIITANI